MSKWPVFLALILPRQSFGEDGTPLALAYFETNWQQAQVEYNNRLKAIQANLAGRGHLCSGGAINEYNNALLDVEGIFYSINLDYVRGLANNRYALDKNALAVSFQTYRHSWVSAMVTTNCNAPVLQDSGAVNQIGYVASQAELTLATIVPLPPLIRVDTVRIREAIVVRDTVIKKDTVKYCPPTLAKASQAIEDYRKGPGIDALGRSTKVWARCKE